MTLGGLALAIGILVDEATVAIENITCPFAARPAIGASRARWIDGDCSTTTVGHAVYPGRVRCVILYASAARALFVPLSLAVWLCDDRLYFLSSTFVP